MNTDITLRVTRIQYREFAEQVKSACACLALSTPKSMGGNFGLFYGMAGSVLLDASKDASQVEVRRVELSTSINTAAFRAVPRPELDWSVLSDDEIYPFVVAHEIGHCVDNFSHWDIPLTDDDELRNRLANALRPVNELLADRYAWSRVRPGEPIPVGENGKREQERISEQLDLLEEFLPPRRRPARRLPIGQYLHVPSAMLMTNELATFVGPAVSPHVVSQVRERSRTYRRDSRSRAY